MTPSIPRHLLPQIPGNKLPEFEKYLSKKGISCTRKNVPINKLVPIQSQFNQDKVDKIVQNPPESPFPLLITADNHIIDGHHRWVAAKQQDEDRIECLVCGCSLPDMLKLAHDFDHSYVKSIHELTTYSRRIIDNHRECSIRQLVREVGRDIIKLDIKEEPEDLTYDDGTGKRLKYTNGDMSGGMGTMMS